MKCVYPGCRASMEEENALCADHEGVTCRYPLHEPLCQERPLPHSSYCREHDPLAAFIINLHAVLHQQAAAVQAQASRQKAVIEQAAARLWNGHN